MADTPKAPNTLADEDISKTLQGITIPPRPQVLVDLHLESAQPEPSLSEIINIISQDVGLTAAIIKTVNSPFFGLARKVSTVQHALAMLGLENALNIANALALRQAMANFDEDPLLVKFWDMQQDIAQACVTIARELNFSTPEEAYTLGLFHNVGVPLMLTRFKDYRAVMTVAYKKGRIIPVEDQFLKTDHATVGYYMARVWHLPEDLTESILQHHNLAEIFQGPAVNDKRRSLIAILKVAEHVCGAYRLLGNQSVDREWEGYKEPILEQLHLDEDELADLIDRLNDMGLRSDY
ncbi:HDOD domain-containing protein [Pokkaliibacter sp. CJK22405]|uniref:HDOD domain-containing protein n=1 Tax=Pokkaliibacter sp. CJK22405 TaxID=3384615 RepID=UPI003984696E